MSYFVNEPEPIVFLCCFCGEIYERPFSIDEFGWFVDIAPSCRVCRIKVGVVRLERSSDEMLDAEWEKRSYDNSLREWLVGAELVKKE